MSTERRMLSCPVEVRAAAGGGRVLVYWSPPWETLSVPLFSADVGGKMLPVRERFRRGAFADVLRAGPDVVALRDHETSRLLGRTGTDGGQGTLSLAEDERGLRSEVLLPDTTEGRDVLALAERRDLRGASFAFTVAEGGEEWHTADGAHIRTVTKVAGLYDTGPVTHPAYQDGPGMDVRTAGLCSGAERGLRRYIRAGGHRQQLSMFRLRLHRLKLDSMR